MHFETSHLYHIYNQGNNREKIFLSRDNYLFFLNKIRTHILPYADILAWCLMPNHFHLMVRINLDSLESLDDLSRGTISRPTTTQTLNKSIGIMLSSYTRAINKQENRSGSLFRSHCKAINLTRPNEKVKEWYTRHGITYINADQPENELPNICYKYILNNPFSAGIVQNVQDWEFSSAKEIMGLRNGS